MDNSDNKEKYHIHISSKIKWYDFHLDEVWRYRDLIILFTKRNFQLIYKQTILGPVWIFLSPFLTSIIYSFVFGDIVGISTGKVPTFLFYMCSNTIWAYFSSCVVKNARTFLNNANVFGKVYFPRLTVPISNMFTSIIQFCIQMIMVMLLFGFFAIKQVIRPNWSIWPFIPLVLIHLGLLGLGFGIIVSSLTTKYRDLSILVDFGVQLWMYATPVVYPLSQLNEGLIKNLLLINPVTAPIEVFRNALLGEGSITLWPILWSIVFTVLIFAFGVILFNKIERSFMDTI